MFEDLGAQVRSNTDAKVSTVALIRGFVSRLAAAKDDPVRLQATIEAMNAEAEPLAGAVVENTSAK